MGQLKNHSHPELDSGSRLTHRFAMSLSYVILTSFFSWRRCWIKTSMTKELDGHPELDSGSRLTHRFAMSLSYVILTSFSLGGDAGSSPA